MATLFSSKIGDIRVLVEAQEVYIDDAGQIDVQLAKVAAPIEVADNAIDDAISVVSKVSEKVRDAIHLARPDELSIAFGIKFTASGGIVVANASGEASLTVSLKYVKSK